MALPLLVTSLDVGAPALQYAAGSWCTVLDWILVTNGGWTILQTGTNKRVYKMSGGSQRCLYVDHSTSSSAGSLYMAETRGCQNATGASYAQLVDPFPTTAQKPGTPLTAANSVFGLDASYNTTVSSPRFYAAWITDKWVRIYTNLSANAWSSAGSYYACTFFFGDLVPYFTGDTWSTCIWANGYVYAAYTVNYVPYHWLGSESIAIGSYSNLFWARDRTGKHVSTFGAPCQTSISGCPTARNGYGSKIDIRPMYASCTGYNGIYHQSSFGLIGYSALQRGWFENTYAGCHSASAASTEASGDTFTSTAYNPSASFRLFQNRNVAPYPMIIMEETNTWTVPQASR